MSDVRSIAMDTSSRTSVALVGVLCARLFKIQPAIESRTPELTAMLGDCDAALIIGDNALLADPSALEKIDLGEAWTTWTGLPFVYAFWAGRAGVLNEADIEALQQARDAGVLRPDEIARKHFPDAPAHQAIGARYLRDNIKYSLGDDERAGLERFFRYASEIGAVARAGPLQFF
jgi:chorismate dehydratase